MKKISLSILFILLFISSNAQKVIDLPEFSATNAKELTIEKIVLTNTAAILHFKAAYWPGTWFRISSGTYLQNGNQKLVARSISGMPFDKEYFPKDGKASFTITFPPLSLKTEKIDFIESDCENCFKFIDIELISSKNASPFPQVVAGDWFKPDGSKQWILGLYEKKAVYESKVWSYDGINVSGSNITIKLKKGNVIKRLYIKTGVKGQLYAGVNKKAMSLLSNDPVNKKYTILNDKGFISPVFKRDSAVYTGYIKGYSPKLGYKTGQVFVNNIITGKQDSYLITINADGSFYCKFPMLYPEECYVRFPSLPSTIYFEPGKKLFQYINLTKNGSPVLYMGDCAAINRELDATRLLEGFDYTKMLKDIADFTPEQYKDYFNAVSDKKLAALNNYRLNNTLSAKAYQLTLMNIKYNAAANLLNVNSTRQYAHKMARNIPMNNLDSTFISAKIDSTYLSFMHTVDLNDKTAVVSNEYNYLVNHLKFIDIISESYNKISTEIYIDELKRKPVLSTAEKELLDALNNAIAAGNNLKVMDGIYKKNAAIIAKLIPGNNVVYFEKKYEERKKGIRTRILNKVLNKNAAFALKIMDAQDKAQDIERELKPLTDIQLAALKNEFADTYIYSAVETYNTSIKHRISENKRKAGYKANKTPKTAADSVFAAIAKKYKGKVIYVDFWATWCVPCRVGIEHIAPLKEEMKDDNVVFVYITNQTSPIGAYNNMIPDIKGEHFRVSSDEWNILSSKFNISGIPHYALVNKKGVVIDTDLKRMENSELKTKLLQIAKE